MDKNKVCTIQDVAKAAGVSAGTVSRYMNGIGECRGNTGERIEQAIKDLNYIPNRSARALKSRRHNLICMAFPESDNPFFFKMIQAVEETAKKAGYELMIYHTHGTVEEELRLLSLMQQDIADGVFLVNFNYTPEHFEAFGKMTCPLVLSSLCISPYGGDPKDTFDYVGVDVRDALYMSASSLLKMGHKKIAYVGGDKDLCVFGERYEGFSRAMQENNVPVREDYLFFGEYDRQAGYRAGKVIAQMEDRPTAVCCVSDVIAIGVMMAFKEYNVRIPEDIAVIGLDDLDMDEAFTPELSSIKMKQEEIGRCAVEMLLDRIKGSTAQPVKKIFKTEPVLRKSTDIII